MKHHTFAGLAAGLVTGGLIGSAPPANAGCMYGGYGAHSRCDDPVQAHGTWQRCMDYNETSGSSSVPWHRHRCFSMGPGQNSPLGLIFNLYPDHIDDGPRNPS
jgi:hypothetical protein